MARERARIGLLWPADGRNDREFWRWLPEDVALLIARYDVGGTLDLDQLHRDADREAIVGAARLLRHAKPNVLTLGDCAGSFVGGKAAGLELAKAVETESGVHAITMSSAIAAASHRLRAKLVAVLSPYPPDVTDRFHKFLGEHDIHVEASHSLHENSEAAIDAMKPPEWRKEVQRTDCTSAQALVVAGGGVSLSGVVSELEAELGKPVITGPGALMWAALEQLRAVHDARNLGALFRAVP